MVRNAQNRKERRMPISINKDKQIFDESGVTYAIGEPISSIANGVMIYEVKGREDVIYVDAADLHENRYDVMKMSTQAINGTGFEKLLWPERLVKKENSSVFSGFISRNPKIQGELVSLDEIIEERKEKKTLSNEESCYYLNLGLQLAEIIELIHQYGYVVGSLSPDKFFVSREGIVYSCISYQFSYRDINAFDNPYYVAPEWLSKMNIEAVVYNEQSDSFLYALILFQLFTGKYPFVSERDVLEVERESLWEAMTDGKSLYFFEDTQMMDGIAQELSVFPINIGKLFKRTFDYCGYEDYAERRPSIQEWLLALRLGNAC